MNLGLLLGVGSSSIPMNSSISPASAEGQAFGSVFQSMIASSVHVKEQPTAEEGKLLKFLGEVLDAGSLDELAGTLEKLQQSSATSVTAQLLKETGLRQSQEQPVILIDEAEVKAIPEQPAETAETEELQLTDLSKAEKFPSLQQLASLLSKNPDKLVEEITNVLEGEYVTEEQLEQIAATGDIWFALDVLHQLPPEKIQEVMEQLPQRTAVEFTALLKAVELAVPKIDLSSSQADSVKTIQPILAQIANQLEQKTVQPEIKRPIQIPPAIQHVIRFTSEQPAADMKQPEQQAKPAETVTPQSAMTHTEARPVFHMNPADKVPESRSEALMREFQAVLNRANFGQTNGMNRLSVKLYPEHLGQIRIELLEVNGVMTARILASTAMAREMLDSQMHQLRHAFNQQNLQVDRIDLSQTIQDPSKSDREQAFNRQNQQQKEQPSEQNEQRDEQEQTFQEFMIELEV
ncbi:flagellar hook-length control protein FliK [Sporosarcina sp. P33]|uniref:flagellar hook-length control protein FliK n=1 Tax=Sporosarcina sp. P33 TaxID=1930764 RepID=UPI0009C05D09|nr:flagellar hook-length control protein FliK [Sporosarcina sp. P33]ARD49299.1 hypothetical protein SporoP33_14285 [Sporosarcina sp. P33]